MSEDQDLMTQHNVDQLLDMISKRDELDQKHGRQAKYNPHNAVNYITMPMIVLGGLGMCAYAAATQAEPLIDFKFLRDNFDMKQKDVVNQISMAAFVGGTILNLGYDYLHNKFASKVVPNWQSQFIDVKVAMFADYIGVTTTVHKYDTTPDEVNSRQKVIDEYREEGMALNKKFKDTGIVFDEMHPYDPRHPNFYNPRLPGY